MRLFKTQNTKGWTYRGSLWLTNDSRFVLALCLERLDDWPFPNSMLTLLSGKDNVAKTYMYQTYIEQDDLFPSFSSRGSRQTFIAREKADHTRTKNSLVEIEVAESFYGVQLKQLGEGEMICTFSRFPHLVICSLFPSLD